MNGRQINKPRNVILLAGAPGTGKKTALECLVREMHAYRLTSRPHFSEIDLQRYEADEISGNFIIDMVEAFQYSEGTVLFKGLKGLIRLLLTWLLSLPEKAASELRKGCA